ncbi:peptide-methionine (R)-S-oxide reductase MsrB [Patescibacteria group bacterium]|nr:peptide-methionine (R)-S-oxide reductase MsrB [Patescibacteria group bacterium]
MKKEFTEEEKHVMHEGGTERPFTGRYWNMNETGTYACKSCGQVLFDSHTKLDSSQGPIGLQGWPAFSQAIPGTVTFKEDTSMGMHRTEVLCSKCGVHLGHVFDNVEEKGTQHYCVNSCSLSFESQSQKNTEL